VFPSTRTENRWVNLVNQLGHYRKCRPTGNNRATVLRDHDLILLSLYRLAYPKATAAEINAFLFRANFGNPMFRFYHPSQISTAESRIGLTRKVGSTTAYQAMLLVNRQKRWCYWNLPYPYGLWTGEGTTGRRMINFMQTILNQIGPGSIARRFCFIMDNLSPHHNRSWPSNCVPCPLLPCRRPNRVCVQHAPVLFEDPQWEHS